MNETNIKLIDNKNFGSYILPDMYTFYANAAAVCFEKNNFNRVVALTIDYRTKTSINLFWESVNQQVKDMHNDLIYAAEQGAYCIAFLLIHQLTDFKVIRQAKRRSGFDFWLGDKDEVLPFTNKAKLEVSGILKGTQTQINQRLKKKEKQIKQSDSINLQAFIIVTEFSKPISKIVEK